MATVMMLENVLASVAFIETSVTHVARDFLDFHTVEVSFSLHTLAPQSLKVLIMSVCIHFFANFLYIPKFYPLNHPKRSCHFFTINFHLLSHIFNFHDNVNPESTNVTPYVSRALK